MIFLSRPHATKELQQRGRTPFLTKFAKGCVPFVAGCGLGLFALAAHAADSADVAIASVMTAFVKPGEPGCTAGVVENGRLTHAQAFGLADVERKKPLDTHSSFNLASVSKQFTAFAVLLLQQDGKLKLDDPVVRYLPELAPSAQGVTLRHLLHHTGGLRDYIAIIGMEGRSGADGATIHEAVQALARQTRPNEGPGVEYEYSNTGYFLLGVVVARVSGQSLAKFSEERIFRPLGMKNTSIVDRYPDGIAQLARGYAHDGNRFTIDETGWEQVGDGQVHSDLHDLALWDENFYTGKLGGLGLIRESTAVGVLNSGEPIDYAAGLRVATTRGLSTVSHGGAWVGYRSQILRFPEQRLTAIVLCNRDDANTEALATSLAEIYLKDRMGPPGTDDEEDEPEAKPSAPAWQPGDLARFTGPYFSAEADATCRLYLRDGALVVEGCAEGAVLKPAAPGQFTDTDESFTLTFPGQGTGSNGFVYDTFGLRGLPFDRVKEPSE